jgi:hypothetical protein
MGAGPTLVCPRMRLPGWHSVLALLFIIEREMCDSDFLCPLLSSSTHDLVHFPQVCVCDWSIDHEDLAISRDLCRLALDIRRRPESAARSTSC